MLSSATFAWPRLVICAMHDAMHAYVMSILLKMRVCVCVVAQDMVGQATLILMSSVSAGIVTAHNKMLQDERTKQGLSNAGLPQISNGAYTASVTMILNCVN